MIDKQTKVDLLRLYGCKDPHAVALDGFFEVDWNDVLKDLITKLNTLERSHNSECTVTQSEIASPKLTS
jgi:hypothetical protein